MSLTLCCGQWPRSASARSSPSGVEHHEKRKVRYRDVLDSSAVRFSCCSAVLGVQRLSSALVVLWWSVLMTVDTYSILGGL